MDSYLINSFQCLEIASINAACSVRSGKSVAIGKLHGVQSFLDSFVGQPTKFEPQFRV